MLKSICQRVHVNASLEVFPRYVTSQLQLDSLEQLSKADLIMAQKRDAIIGQVVGAVKQGVWPSNRDLDPELLLMKREVGRLMMFRASKKANEEALQLMLPAEFRGQVLCSLHDDMGHLGVEMVTDLLRSRFYCCPRWLMMQRSLQRIVGCA